MKAKAHETQPNLDKTLEKRARSKMTPRRSRRARGSVPRIELYQREDCPFSHAVRTKLTELGLDFVAHTIPAGDALKHKELVEAGGKDQIPFLVDHQTGVHLYDSGVIRTYLENEYGDPIPGAVGRAIKQVDERLRRQVELLRWAVRVPVERARRVGGEITDGVHTLLGTFRYLRQAVRQETPPGDQDAELA
jgi:glutathione S-transferase